MTESGLNPAERASADRAIKERRILDEIERILRVRREDIVTEVLRLSRELERLRKEASQP